MIEVFRKDSDENGVSPVIGVILVVAIVIILAALIGTILFGFTDQLDGGSTNAAFELNEQEGTITPIQAENGTEYDVIVDGNKKKTISGNSVGKAIQIDNASSGSTVQIVNPQTDQVIQEWEIDENTNISNDDNSSERSSLININSQEEWSSSQVDVKRNSIINNGVNKAGNNLQNSGNNISIWISKSYKIKDVQNFNLIMNGSKSSQVVILTKDTKFNIPDAIRNSNNLSKIESSFQDLAGQASSRSDYVLDGKTVKDPSNVFNSNKTEYVRVININLQDSSTNRISLVEPKPILEITSNKEFNTNTINSRTAGSFETLTFKNIAEEKVNLHPFTFLGFNQYPIRATNTQSIADEYGISCSDVTFVQLDPGESFDLNVSYLNETSSPKGASVLADTGSNCNNLDYDLNDPYTKTQFNIDYSFNGSNTVMYQYEKVEGAEVKSLNSNKDIISSTTTDQEGKFDESIITPETKYLEVFLKNHEDLLGRNAQASTRVNINDLSNNNVLFNKVNFLGEDRLQSNNSVAYIPSNVNQENALGGIYTPKLFEGISKARRGTNFFMGRSINYNNYNREINSTIDLTGSLYGEGKTISNAQINNPLLFDVITQSSQVSNLNLKDLRTSSGELNHPIAKINKGTLKNITVSMDISPREKFTGLVDANEGVIKDSSTSIMIKDELPTNFGGIAIANRGTIKNVDVDLSTDNLTSPSLAVQYIGGIVSENSESGIIENADIQGDLEAPSYYVAGNKGGGVGGISGINKGEIIDSTTNLKINGHSKLGTVTGLNDGGTIQNVQIEVDSIEGSQNYVGGIVGRSYNSGTITNVSLPTSTLSVNGSDRTGGLIGQAVGIHINPNIISNEKINDIQVNGKAGTGGVVGVIKGATVTNIEIGSNVEVYGGGEDGTIRGAGGGFGRFYGDMLNVTSKATVKGSTHIGGLVGVSTGTIYNSSSNSIVSGKSQVGGLVGELGEPFESSGTITNSVSSSTVNYDPSYSTNVEGEIGGLVGSNMQSSISKSKSTATINAGGSSTYSVGGLVGVSIHGDIKRTVANADVNGNQAVGGIVGRISGGSEVSNAYSESSVSGNDDVGGIVGRVSDAAPTGSPEVSKTLSTGNINSNEDVGPIIGLDRTSFAASDSYWDSLTTGLSNSSTLPSENGLPTSELQGEQQNLNDKITNTFDFSSIWEANANDYPKVNLPF